MAHTKTYLSHLLQNTGITPACSEEERAAAGVIAKVFTDHGFTPEVQEFSASGSTKIVQAGLGVVVFIGAVLMGIGGVFGIVGLLLCLAAAVIFAMERSGRQVLSQLGSGGLSQNVIAYHKASGPLASPRNRPVVVVAHYDSPRADLLSQQPYAAYRPLLVKLLPFAMIAPAVLAVLRLFPFPDAAKVVLWLLAIVAALIPLAQAVAIIANRFVLPYTTGAVCNKSSVAAMLGVMDAVAPYELGDEFPSDQPADEYFAEQQRLYEEALAVAEAAAAAEAAYPHELEEGEAAEGGADEAESEEGQHDTAPVDGEASDDELEAAEADELEPSATGMLDVDGLTSGDEMGSTAMMEAVDVDEEREVQGDIAVDINEDQTAEVDDENMAADGFTEAVDGGFSGATQVFKALSDQDLVQDELPLSEEASVDSDEDAAHAPAFRVNTSGNIRFGENAVRALGMLPASCAFVYEAEEVEDDVEPTAFEVARENGPVAEGYEDSDYSDAADEVEAYEDEDDDLIVEAEADSSEDAWAEEDVDLFEDEEDDWSDDDAADSEFDEAGEDEDFEVEDDLDPSDEAFEPAVSDQDTVNDEDVSSQEQSFEEDGTVQFSALEVDDASTELSGTIAMPAQRMDTVDSLMAEISRDVPSEPAQPKRRVISVPSTTDAPVPHTPPSANRASLFDLPDPSSTPVDPFAVSNEHAPAVVTDEHAAEARSAFTVVSSHESPYDNPEVFDRIETVSAPAPEPVKPRRGLARLFGRKKKNDDSMSEWLGVEEDFDAKQTGGDIGSWDNFDDDGWKGGAAGYEGATEEELREAIADMGDDELLGHDIWFVATGASENDNAGIRAFLDTHRDKLRGVFLINLESVGAGQLAMLSTEGERRVLKGDKRIMKLIQQVSSDFHHPINSVDMPYVTTDAHVAMGMSLRSLTLAGVDETGIALSHTEDDQPYNVDLDNVAVVSDVVTEVIRRS